MRTPRRSRPNDARAGAEPVPAGRRVSIPPPRGSRGLRQARGIEQPAPVGFHDCGDAALDAELAHRVAQVLLDRVVAEEEARADLAVRAALRREPEDSELLAGELRPRRSRAGRRRSGPRVDRPPPPRAPAPA